MMHDPRFIARGGIIVASLVNYHVPATSLETYKKANAADASMLCQQNVKTMYFTRSSQSIKIGIDLSIDKSIKIGKSDLIDIDCIDQSVEIDDTLASSIDLSRFYWFHRFLSEDTPICSSVHPKLKTDFMQTVNMLTIELQLRVEGSNNLLSLF